MSTKASPLKLSIITITYNDLIGLKQTIKSVSSIPRENLEYWIIDGNSIDGTKEYLKQTELNWINVVSEPDRGLYDAMNKGIERATGDYVIFLNAGDLFQETFTWEAFLKLAPGHIEEKVLIGRTIEKYQTSSYLRPGYGHESLAYTAPPHQATFYPRKFFVSERFRLDKPIKSDGNYTRRAIQKCGAAFVPMIISEFFLGGISSSYGIKSIKLRLSELGNINELFRLIMKVILWYTLPRRFFYQALAISKYTKLS